MGCGGSHCDVRPTLYIWPGSAPCRAVMMAASAAKVRLHMQYIDILKGEQHSSKFQKVGHLWILFQSLQKRETMAWNFRGPIQSTESRYWIIMSLLSQVNPKHTVPALVDGKHKVLER